MLPTANNNPIAKKLYAVSPRIESNTLYPSGHVGGRCVKTSYGKVCGAELGYIHQLSHFFLQGINISVNIFKRGHNIFLIACQNYGENS